MKLKTQHSIVQIYTQFKTQCYLTCFGGVTYLTLPELLQSKLAGQLATVSVNVRRVEMFKAKILFIGPNEVRKYLSPHSSVVYFYFFVTGNWLDNSFNSEKTDFITLAS